MTSHLAPIPLRRPLLSDPLRVVTLIGAGLLLLAAAPPVLAQSADLAVTLDDVADPVALGASVTYLVTVHNGGPDAASNLEVVLTLDAAATFAAADGGDWTCSHSGDVTGGEVSCTLASLAADTDADLVTVEVTAPTTVVTLTSEATVGSDTADPDSGNDTEDETTEVIVAADLELSKVADPDPVDAEQTLTYTLSVTNHGPSDAVNLEVVDDLPPDATDVAWSGTGWDCLYDADQDQLACTRPSLAAGLFTPDLVVTVTAPCGVTSLDNTATVSSDTPDLASGNDSVSMTTAVTPVADLSITLADSPDPVRARESLDYAVAVANAGPCEASDVEVLLTLPDDTVYGSASGTDWSCSHAGGMVTCSSSTLAVGSAP